ncbi:MAG: hypothetical protein AAGU04_00050 [Anaerolineaceae bacterium]
MKYKVVVPMSPSLQAFETGRQSLPVNFPQRCVYCNKPVETYQIIDLSGGKTVGKRTASFSAQLHVPYCLDHSIVFSKYKKLLSAIGLPVFLVVFIGWFFLFTPLTEFGNALPPGLNFLLLPLIFPCIGNLILGFLAIILVHFLLLLFEPKFRQVPFVTNDGGLGFTVQMKTSMYAVNSLEFAFTNRDYAGEFADANHVSMSE